MTASREKGIFPRQKRKLKDMKEELEDKDGDSRMGDSPPRMSRRKIKEESDSDYEGVASGNSIRRGYVALVVANRKGFVKRKEENIPMAMDDAYGSFNQASRTQSLSKEHMTPISYENFNPYPAPPAIADPDDLHGTTFAGARAAQRRAEEMVTTADNGVRSLKNPVSNHNNRTNNDDQLNHTTREWRGQMPTKLQKWERVDCWRNNINEIDTATLKFWDDDGACQREFDPVRDNILHDDLSSARRALYRYRFTSPEHVRWGEYWHAYWESAGETEYRNC